MKSGLKFIFSWLFLLISVPLFSQVKDTMLLDKVLRELKLDENEIYMELVTDKVLPFSVEKTFLLSQNIG
ncbi:hypothetical protein LEQ04_07545 [Riemerella anatipestifer]|nr:hypothetical protein LEQ05_11940 [Riemerella anatipestifer]WPC13769.1 hypothetical protein LEQ03_03750 [Riemerella anatipestifer]WPC14477.1 hypothetical protein LEQ04_07545 [Riemerella anatipestifer]